MCVECRSSKWTKFTSMFMHPLTDDLRRIIGSDTTRRGMLCVFEMFQQQALNRRLVYVLMEGMLASLFPNNKFCELFRKWHATSPTISMVSVHSGSTGGGARSPLATPETAHRQMAAPLSGGGGLGSEATGSGTRWRFQEAGSSGSGRPASGTASSSARLQADPSHLSQQQTPWNDLGNRTDATRRHKRHHSNFIWERY